MSVDSSISWVRPSRSRMRGLSFLMFRHLPLKSPSARSHDAGTGGRRCAAHNFDSPRHVLAFSASSMVARPRVTIGRMEMTVLALAAPLSGVLLMLAFSGRRSGWSPMSVRSASLPPRWMAGRCACPGITITTIHRIRITLSYSAGWLRCRRIRRVRCRPRMRRAVASPRGVRNALAGRQIHAVPLEREEKP